jgi:hypothetical protein
MVCGPAAAPEERSLVYRSIDHKTLLSLCRQLSQSRPQNVAVTPRMCLGPIADLAGLVVSLQGERHLAEMCQFPKNGIGKRGLEMRTNWEVGSWETIDFATKLQIIADCDSVNPGLRYRSPALAKGSC